MEAEKFKAEAERSIALVKEKLAHGLIEEVERLRRERVITSFRERVENHIRDVSVFLLSLLNAPWREAPDPAIRQRIEFLMKIYQSIRKDFGAIAEMNENKLSDLFPEESKYFETFGDAIIRLMNMISQERQMVSYLIRVPRKK